MLLPTVFAATCGNNIVENGEQCEQYRFRGYSCGTICYLDANSPHEYDPTERYDYEDFSCYTMGSLTCDSNCRITTGSCNNNVCGDGTIYGLEECDDGTQSSDTQPDACRTDCTLPKCGDDVVDSGEECDDGLDNSDAVPDACRTDCTYAHCGDGVIDVREGEECDDDNGACFHCMRCVEPHDDLILTADTKLCPGTYQLDDQEEEGVIIVSGNGITVECEETSLYGVPRDFEILAEQELHAGALQNIGGQANVPAQASNVPAAQTAPATEQQSSGFFASIVHFVANIFNGEGDEAPIPTYGNAISEMKVGTGFLVNGDENVLIGCEVRNYRTGIKDEGSRNVFTRTIACQNSRDFHAENQSSVGLNNRCGSGLWHDVGYERCTYTCSGDDGTMTNETCPACPTVTTCDENESKVTETLIDCPDGSTAATLTDCPPDEPEDVECPDGSRAGTLAECPEAEVSCPRGEIICDDGETCVDKAWKCDPYICDDGTLVEQKKDCPSHCDEYECNDGDCVDEEWKCHPYVCDDGSLAPSRSECPEPCKGVQCDDGDCVDAAWQCNPFVCDDGTEVESEEDCPQQDPCPGGVQCADGKCADSPDSCMVCCKTTGGLAAPITYYGMTTVAECDQAGGVAVANSFCS